MFEEALEIVIVGTTVAGRAFRPSDWAERLCGMMSVFSEDRHLSYSPYLKPVMSAGVRCVVVDRELEKLDPAAYSFLFGFARDNELTLRPGRKNQRPEDIAPAPLLAGAAGDGV
ncbi:MAG: DUF3579 domain-containing protein [Betaproteobacteria bacterium]|nr:DUF3579 domain-containing protein [Betaproteobacteria bacterium]